MLRHIQNPLNLIHFNIFAHSHNQKYGQKFINDIKKKKKTFKRKLENSKITLKTITRIICLDLCI